jgi:hypothetical protein
MLYLITITGSALAAWLVFYGLQLRFFGSFVSFKGALAWLTPPLAFISGVGGLSAGVSAADLGWPLLVVGSSLMGAIAGLWLRQKWASRSLLFFSTASIITFHWMNCLSILLLLFLRNKALLMWLDQHPDSDG